MGGRRRKCATRVEKQLVEERIRIMISSPQDEYKRRRLLLFCLRRPSLSLLLARCCSWTDSSERERERMSSSQPQQVRASHLLIKHSGSRRKASWKDPDGSIIKNTTRDSAVAQLKSLRDEIVAGKARFDDLASRYSDCNSAKRGGDLGQFLFDSPLFRNFITHASAYALRDFNHL
ncbi:hypothetical protein ACLOJK_027898 [Asimina triloba]